MQSNRVTTTQWAHWGLHAGDGAQIFRHVLAKKLFGRAAMVAHR